MKHNSLITFAAIGVMSVALTARGSVTLTYIGSDVGQNVGMKVLAADNTTVLLAQGNYFAGTEKIQVNGGPIIKTFCIDLGDFTTPSSTADLVALESAPDAWAGPMGTTAANNIKALWATYYSSALTSASVAAALQVAIWRTIDDVMSTYSIVFSDTSATSVYYAAGQMMLNATGTADLEAITGAAQDFIVPVPEPTTMIAGALLLLPFGASALRIVRRKA